MRISDWSSDVCSSDLDRHLPTALFRSDDGVGEDGHYTLTHEPHDVVENVGVVRIDKVVGMYCRGEELARHVFPGVDAMDTGDGERLGGVDGGDACMCVRRVQDRKSTRLNSSH